MNPLMAIMQMMRGGGNPQAMLNQILNQNNITGKGREMAINAFNMFQSGNTSGLQNLADNLAKSKNTSVEEVKNQIMGQSGMK